MTGGSKGIGAATCRALAANAAKVVVVARSREPIDELVDELRASGAQAIGISADCNDLAELERVRRDVESEFGPVDLLVPFAGGFERFTPVAEMTIEEWREVIDANLTSTFIAVKTFMPHISRDGKVRWSRCHRYRDASSIRRRRLPTQRPRRG